MSLLKPEHHRNIFFFGLLLTALTLPFAVKLNSAFIILLCVNWLLEGNYRNKLRMLLQRRTAIIFTAFFLLHLLGLLYTENLRTGTFEVEKKLSLALLPLMLSTTPQVSRDEGERILKGFLLSCSLAALICLAAAVYFYSNDHDTKHFFYHSLSEVLRFHAVYFSLYLAFCLFILLRWIREAGVSMRPWLVCWMLFLLLMMFLLASKMILIAAFLLLNGYFIFRWRRESSPARRFLLILAVNILLSALLLSLPGSRERFSSELDSDWSVLRQENYTYATPFTGTSLRLVFWKFCVQILDENNAWFTCVGTGDGQQLLDEKYRAQGLYTGKPGTADHGYLGYNAHNQYMDTLLVLGIPGLLLLLGCMGMVIRQAWRQGKVLLLCMLLLFLLFSFTEVTLATQKGTVFFSFFTSLLLYQYRENDTEK